MNGHKSLAIRPTSIPALDEMLSGGMPSNAAILLAGPPGAGKSIFALQWLFGGFREYQDVGVYFTMTEPTTKLLKNVAKMSFFDSEAVSSVDLRADGFGQEIVKRPGLHFIDLRVIMGDIGIGKKELTHRDADKVIDVITKAVESTGAKRIVIDSITALTYRMPNDDMVRRLIFELGTYLGTLDANVLMISESTGLGTGNLPFGVEAFISDGVIRLGYNRVGRDLVRTFEVVKMRGIDYDSNATVLRITPDGMQLFPRKTFPITYPVSSRRQATGISGLDEMMAGGVLEGTTMGVMGPSGVGKTVLAMHFIYNGLQAGEHCLYVSFEESRDQIVQNAGAFGWDLAAFEKSGTLSFLIGNPEVRYIDEHIKMIMDAVEKSGAKRVVIDSLSAIANDFGVDAVRDFGSRMTFYLKGKQVSWVFTMATEGLTGGTTLSESHLSTIVDTIIVLRYVEIESELRRALLILKMRGTAHDRKLREVIIGPQGMSVSSDFSGYEGVLSGSSRKVAESTEEQVRVLFLEVMGPMGEKIFSEEKKKGLTLDRVRALIEQMGKQGVISVRRKEEFQARLDNIFKARH